MKFTEHSEQTYRALYTNFQSILKFYKSIKIFSINGYRWLTWSCMCLGKLSEMSYPLNLHENESILSQE